MPQWTAVQLWDHCITGDACQTSTLLSALSVKVERQSSTLAPEENCAPATNYSSSKLCGEVRERIASNKAAALAKRAAKARTARNKEAAIAKRRVLCRTPKWHIKTDTDRYFAISVNNEAIVQDGINAHNALVNDVCDSHAI